MMVGLTTPTEGTATISGRLFADLPNPGREVGVLLDASAQHAGRTGREILTLARYIMGAPAARVDEMLELVSLTGAEADRRVAQLLARHASAPRHRRRPDRRPVVLILDEPANGLDPAGIRWMRDLLRDHADHGGTVLLSSHLLAEIEIIADDIVMIGQRRIVAQAPRPNCCLRRAPSSAPRPRSSLQLALAAVGLVVTAAADGALRTDADTALVGKVALDGGVVLIELRKPTSAGLEEMFLELTGDTERKRTDNRTEEAVA